MSRIRLLTSREELSPEQQSVFDAITGSRGGVRGPFPILLHRPTLASGLDKVGGHLRYQSTLAPAVRECAILATARLMQAQIPWAAHFKQATEAGVDETTLDSIKELKLDAIPGDIGTAVQFARSLVEEHHVSPELFARAARSWNVDELVDLASLIGYYSLVSIVLNAFDEAAPPRITS
jgi:4-carboxymuconolactone decarboxylase